MDIQSTAKVATQSAGQLAAQGNQESRVNEARQAEDTFNEAKEAPASDTGADVGRKVDIRV